MGERHASRPENDDVSMTRRQFVKGILAFGAASSIAGSEIGKRLGNDSERETEEQAARMVIYGDLRDKKVAGVGIDAFYDKSGWSDTYSLDVFEKAVVLANKGVDVYAPKENQFIKIPYKKVEES